jgi:hypothetical protein
MARQAGMAAVRPMAPVLLQEEALQQEPPAEARAKEAEEALRV